MGSQRGPGQGLGVGRELRAGYSHSVQARVGAGHVSGQPGTRGWAQVDTLSPQEGLQVGGDGRWG